MTSCSSSVVDGGAMAFRGIRDGRQPSRQPPKKHSGWGRQGEEETRREDQEGFVGQGEVFPAFSVETDEWRFPITIASR